MSAPKNSECSPMKPRNSRKAQLLQQSLRLIDSHNYKEVDLG